MKTCLMCGAMISPHPMHRETTGFCVDCVDIGQGDQVDHDHPKIKGKHMVITKSPEQIAIEKRQKQRRFMRY